MMTQIVYVQPGSIYLAIGAKSSCVRNIVVYGKHKSKLLEKFHMADFTFCDEGKSFRDSSPLAIIHTADSH